MEIIGGRFLLLMIRKRDFDDWEKMLAVFGFWIWALMMKIMVAYVSNLMLGHIWNKGQKKAATSKKLKSIYVVILMYSPKYYYMWWLNHIIRNYFFIKVLIIRLINLMLRQLDLSQNLGLWAPCAWYDENLVIY